MEEGFFRKATKAEHEALIAHEKKFSRKEIIFYFLVTTISVTYLGAYIDYFLNGKPANPGSKGRVIYAFMESPVSFIFFFLILAGVIGFSFFKAAQFKKIKNGDFAVQKVKVIGISTKYVKGKRTTTFTLMSDAGMLYVADTSGIVNDEMAINQRGLFFLINENRKNGLIDGYRFIPVFESGKRTHTD